MSLMINLINDIFLLRLCESTFKRHGVCVYIYKCSSSFSSGSGTNLLERDGTFSMLELSKVRGGEKVWAYQ